MSNIHPNIERAFSTYLPIYCKTPFLLTLIKVYLSYDHLTVLVVVV